MAKEIRLMHYDYLVVGAGLYGAVFAHEAAAARKRVLVVEKRSHIAGNVYTEEQAGIQVHRYGAHIFHTLCAARAAWRRPGWRPGSPAPPPPDAGRTSPRETVDPSLCPSFLHNDSMMAESSPAFRFYYIILIISRAQRKAPCRK